MPMYVIKRKVAIETITEKKKYLKVYIGHNLKLEKFIGKEVSLILVIVNEIYGTSNTYSFA